MGLWRTVFSKDRSLYLNLPKGVTDEAGLSPGDRVHVRYVEGIGIVVSFPINLTRGSASNAHEYLKGIAKRGRTAVPVDGDKLPVIPLFDGVPTFRKK